MREYAAAPIHTSGVALRHGGPRDATSVPPSILAESLTSTGFVAPDLNTDARVLPVGLDGISGQPVG